ncbi:MAG: hypothetical protein LBG48_06110 [Rickettsiales bacterium]|jgi:hypothetical protein|nr:hypothetical protein [Rickettsiales bacterium]
MENISMVVDLDDLEYAELQRRYGDYDNRGDRKTRGRKNVQKYSRQSFCGDSGEDIIEDINETIKKKFAITNRKSERFKKLLDTLMQESKQRKIISDFNREHEQLRCLTSRLAKNSGKKRNKILVEIAKSERQLKSLIRNQRNNVKKIKSIRGRYIICLKNMANMCKGRINNEELLSRIERTNECIDAAISEKKEIFAKMRETFFVGFAY